MWLPVLLVGHDSPELFNHRFHLCSRQQIKALYHIHILNTGLLLFFFAEHNMTEFQSTAALPASDGKTGHDANGIQQPTLLSSLRSVLFVISSAFIVFAAFRDTIIWYACKMSYYECYASLLSGI